MAFAATISLLKTLMQHKHSSPPSVFSPARKLLTLAIGELVSLRKVLERSKDRGRKELNALEGLIGEEVNKLEGFFDSEESKRFFFFTREESGGSVKIVLKQKTAKKKPSINLEKIRRRVNSFAETVKKLKEEYISELYNTTPDAEEEEEKQEFDTELVGVSEDFAKLKELVLRRMRPDDSGVLSIVGMAGSGRSSVAELIFNELLFTGGYLGCSAWVTISPRSQLKEILVSILAQIHMDFTAPSFDHDEKLLVERLYASLEGRRYLIVLDDVYDPRIWEALKSAFPEQENGSLVLQTTNQMEVAEAVDNFYIHKMHTFPEADSWEFLNKVTFHGNCPPEFLEAGEKIAKNCRGLRIPLARVALMLCQADKTPENWNQLAADEENPIFRVGHEISELRMTEQDLLRFTQKVNEEGNVSVTEVSRLLIIYDEVREVRSNILCAGYYEKMELYTLFGMAGIGKTALANKIYEHPSVVDRFHHRVWVTLGPKYQSKDMVVDIFAQIYPHIDKMGIRNMDPQELHRLLAAELSHKRCLILLDDVWDDKPLNFLVSMSYIKGMVLVTTRDRRVAIEARQRMHEMRLLNREESWDLLREKVFGTNECPPGLWKVGIEIAEKCDGLPLLILAVAKGLVSIPKCENIAEVWDNVAKKRDSYEVFKTAENEVLKVLLPSYTSLSQQLRSCFLYMGVFTRRYEISAAKLIRLWAAEGFLEPPMSPEYEGATILSELADRSLVMICKKGWGYYNIKICRLHSICWHLSNDESANKKVFHALNSYDDISAEAMDRQSRFCIRKNTLLSVQDVHDSLAASCETARSLLSTSPPSPYEVQINLGLRFLRVLDVLTIRFYTFPSEVLKLIHLRYLALTCNGNLPNTISNLWKLQYLILSRHQTVMPPQDSLYLPVKIWDLKELIHLQIMGSSLPNPHFGAVLPKLSTVLDMNARNCTKEILEKLSNLKRLGVQIELKPDDDGKTFHYLNHISKITFLESLKCVVVNPELKNKVVVPPRSMFPRLIKKLSLSGLGYPWEYMSVIGKLELLEELKLKCYAFQGPCLETDGSDFVQLRFLLIQDTDLECWEIKRPRSNRLEFLSIRHCYNLEKLPHSLPPRVEMVDCNPIIMTWAKETNQKLLKNSNYWVTRFDVCSSLDGKILQK